MAHVRIQNRPEARYLGPIKVEKRDLPMSISKAFYEWMNLIPGYHFISGFISVSY